MSTAEIDRLSTEPDLAASPATQGGAALSKDDGKTYYPYLDWARGIAALLVLMYHADFMFGARGRLFPDAFLCVDLFYVLSGFVLYVSYNRRFEGGLRFSQFFIHRMARLYPLFLATTLLGLVVNLLAAFAQKNIGHLAPALLEAMALNGAMLPYFGVIAGKQRLFPLNGASWSIFFEVVINIYYFYASRALKPLALCILLVAAGVLLSVIGLGAGTLDLGWSSDNIIGGFGRVTYSFLAGLVIGRVLTGRKPALPAFLGFTSLLAIPVLCAAPLLLGFEHGTGMQLTMVLVLFPVLVIVAAAAKGGPHVRAVGKFVGDISYGVYLIHTPLMLLFSAAPEIFHRKIADFAPYVGYIFVATAIVLAWFSYRWLELPAKSFIQKLAPRRTA